MIGRPHNVEFVKWLYAHVAVQLRQMALVAMRLLCPEVLPGPQGAWTRTFCYSAVGVISNRLYAQRHQDEVATPQSTALVHVSEKQLEQAVARYYGKTFKIGRPAAATAGNGARELGHAAGQQVSLNRPMSAGAQPRALHGGA